MSALRASLIRLRGLVGKEFLQILRDPSALMIAFLLPVVLLLINGFGISLDARDMRVAAVIDAPEESTRALLQALSNSPYLDVVRVNDTQEGAALMADGSVRGMLVLREDFSQHLQRPARWPAHAQLLVNATDPNTARILEGYVQGALETWLSGIAIERRLVPAGGVSVEHRYWFNPELRSADFIIPGMVAFVMSMTGTLLTALIVAREWERGTMESMLASPARMGELIAAKLGSYFVLGMAAMASGVLIAILLFGVPFRGSVLVLTLASALFLVFALSLGLFISTLAGMVYDIASMPGWLQAITFAVPARYLVSILQTLFLAGTVWPLLLPNLGALALAAAVALGATLAITRRRLD